jgi:hypothetical protein
MDLIWKRDFVMRFDVQCKVSEELFEGGSLFSSPKPAKHKLTKHVNLETSPWLY